MTAHWLAYASKNSVTFGRDGSAYIARSPYRFVEPAGTSIEVAPGFGSKAYVGSQPPVASTMTRFFPDELAGPASARFDPGRDALTAPAAQAARTSRRDNLMTSSSVVGNARILEER